MGWHVALCLGVLAAFAGIRQTQAADGSELMVAQAASDAIAITEALAQAQERFEGTVIEAELDVGRPHEKTDVVYELRMLTPRGDILRIRIDARDGTILEADGRGLVDARRR